MIFIRINWLPWLRRDSPFCRHSLGRTRRLKVRFWIVTDIPLCKADGPLWDVKNRYSADIFEELPSQRYILLLLEIWQTLFLLTQGRSTSNRKEARHAGSPGTGLDLRFDPLTQSAATDHREQQRYRCLQWHRWGRNRKDQYIIPKQQCFQICFGTPYKSHNSEWWPLVRGCLWWGVFGRGILIWGGRVRWWFRHYGLLCPHNLPEKDSWCMAVLLPLWRSPARRRIGREHLQRLWSAATLSPRFFIRWGCPLAWSTVFEWPAGLKFRILVFFQAGDQRQTPFAFQIKIINFIRIKLE